MPVPAHDTVVPWIMVAGHPRRPARARAQRARPARGDVAAGGVGGPRGAPPHPRGVGRAALQPLRRRALPPVRHPRRRDLAGLLRPPPARAGAAGHRAGRPARRPALRRRCPSRARHSDELARADRRPARGGHHRGVAGGAGRGRPAPRRGEPRAVGGARPPRRRRPGAGGGGGRPGPRHRDGHRRRRCGSRGPRRAPAARRRVWASTRRRCSDERGRARGRRPGDPGDPRRRGDGRQGVRPDRRGVRRRRAADRPARGLRVAVPELALGARVRDVRGGAGRAAPADVGRRRGDPRAAHRAAGRRGAARPRVGGHRRERARPAPPRDALEHAGLAVARRPRGPPPPQADPDAPRAGVLGAGPGRRPRPDPHRARQPGRAALLGELHAGGAAAPDRRRRRLLPGAHCRRPRGLGRGDAHVRVRDRHVRALAGAVPAQVRLPGRLPVPGGARRPAPTCCWTATA